MMDPFPVGWSEIFEEMLPRNDCDICRPPLDIGPPPPLPANFQDKAVLSGSCNVCSVISDVEIRPIQMTDVSLLPVAATFVVGILFVLITVIVLLLRIKKCQAFMPHVCWLFPRNALPHTELAPSSLPSPSPSTEKLKDKHHPSSLHSENIYEVCSPPDSLYEEVGECSPYGVVMVENALNAQCRFQPSLMRTILPGAGRFSTFGGTAHGFVNPAVHDVNAQTLRGPYRPGYVQRRELPPVPGDGY